MSFLQKEIFYWDKYATTIGYSTVFMILLAYVGLWLILKRASLFGLVLTSLAKVAFVFGFGLHEIFAHSDEVADTLHTGLDLYVFSITSILVVSMTVLIRRLRSQEKSTETLFAIILVLATSSIPLIHKLFQHTDVSLSHSYFSEILYTDPHLFHHYLPAGLLLLVVMLALYRPIKLVVFDSDQALILGLKAGAIEFVFFLAAGLLTAVCVRVMGIYLAMAIMLIPGYSALVGFRHLASVLAGTILIALGGSLLGFTTTFYLDSLPTEPVLIVSLAALGLLVVTVRSVLRAAHNK